MKILQRNTKTKILITTINNHQTTSLMAKIFKLT